jgi:ankyrin repeat protein
MNHNAMKKLARYFIFIALSLVLSSPAMAEEDVPYLLTVSAKGDIATLRALLESGTNPNTRDIDNVTALMYAARKDKSEIVKALLERGADPNAKDNSGWTALMLAARKNYLKTACLLYTSPSPRDES